jgi:hypothetical protein
VIHLTKGIDNTIYFTGKERVTITGDYSYQIVLSRNNEDVYVITGDDISPYPNRYNCIIATSELYQFSEVTTKGDYEYTYKILAVDNDDNSEQVETGYCFLHVLEDSPIFTQRESTSIFKQRD